MALCESIGETTTERHRNAPRLGDLRNFEGINAMTEILPEAETNKFLWIQGQNVCGALPKPFRSRSDASQYGDEVDCVEQRHHQIVEVSKKVPSKSSLVVEGETQPWERKKVRRRRTSSGKMTSKDRKSDGGNGLADAKVLNSPGGISSGESSHSRRRGRLPRRASEAVEVVIEGIDAIDNVDKNESTRSRRRSCGASLPDMARSERSKARRRKSNDSARFHPKVTNRRSSRLKLTQLKSSQGLTGAESKDGVKRLPLDDADLQHVLGPNHTSKTQAQSRSLRASAHARLGTYLKSTTGLQMPRSSSAERSCPGEMGVSRSSHSRSVHSSKLGSAHARLGAPLKTSSTTMKRSASVERYDPDGVLISRSSHSRSSRVFGNGSTHSRLTIISIKPKKGGRRQSTGEPCFPDEIITNSGKNGTYTPKSRGSEHRRRTSKSRRKSSSEMVTNRSSLRGSSKSSIGDAKIIEREIGECVHVSEHQRRHSNPYRNVDNDLRSASERGTTQSSHRGVLRSTAGHEKQAESQAGFSSDLRRKEASVVNGTIHSAVGEPNQESDSTTWLDGFLDAAHPSQYRHLGFTESEDESDCDAEAKHFRVALGAFSAASIGHEDIPQTISPQNAPRRCPSKHALESRPRSVKTVRKVLRCSVAGDKMPDILSLDTADVNDVDSPNRRRGSKKTSDLEVEISRTKEDQSDSQAPAKQGTSDSCRRRSRKKKVASKAKEVEVTDSPQKRIDKARSGSLLLMGRHGVENSNQENASHELSSEPLRGRPVRRSQSCGDIGELSHEFVDILEKRVRSLSQDVAVCALRPRERGRLENHPSSEMSVGIKSSPQDLSTGNCNEKKTEHGDESSTESSIKNVGNEKLFHSDSKIQSDEGDSSIQKPSSARFRSTVPKEKGTGLATPCRKSSLVKDDVSKFHELLATPPTAETNSSVSTENRLPVVPFYLTHAEGITDDLHNSRREHPITTNSPQSAAQLPPAPVRKQSRRPTTPGPSPKDSSQPPATPVRKLSRKPVDPTPSTPVGVAHPPLTPARRASTPQASCMPPLTPLRKLSLTNAADPTFTADTRLNDVAPADTSARCPQNRWSSEITPTDRLPVMNGLDPDVEENRERRARPTKEQRAQGVETTFTDLAIYDGNSSFVSDITDCWSVAQSSCSSGRENEVRTRGGAGPMSCSIIDEGSPVEIDDSRWAT